MSLSGKIISVSRRTDVPAFYREWFRNRIDEGFAGYVNPFGGQRYIISLKPEDVIAFVFWSKAFTGFIDDLDYLEEKGYNYHFNYTVNGYGEVFEPYVPELDVLLQNCRDLAKRYSPKHINWRYDPIVISDVTPPEYHLARFEEIASALEGAVERCYFSFVQRYGKVMRNFDALSRERGVVFRDPEQEGRVELAGRIAQIAAKYGITMYTCCGDYLVSDNIKKASCVDAGLIGELFYGGDIGIAKRPSRKECGCYASVDIGAYDTCPHGCVYCYANANKAAALRKYEGYNPASPFLGVPSAKAKQWLKELERNVGEGNGQGGLFI
ncbi:MAG: DUF1848 domain-containing protein [bacterium]|nr:DUF1848 domain-containing protein [bacterium]